MSECDGKVITRHDLYDIESMYPLFFLLWGEWVNGEPDPDPNQHGNSWQVDEKNIYFEYYITSQGEGAMERTSAGRIFQNHLFNEEFSVNSMHPGTYYTYRGMAKFKKFVWDNPEEGHWEEAWEYGDWVTFLTPAYVEIEDVYVCNIDKESGRATLYAAITITHNKTVEVGFEYRVDSNPNTQKIFLEGNYPVGFFHITGYLPTNTNFSIRSYAKTVSGYVSNSRWEEKLTTKEYTDDVAIFYPCDNVVQRINEVVQHASEMGEEAEIGDKCRFMASLSKNGMINNTWEVKHDVPLYDTDRQRVTLDKMGIAYYGYDDGGGQRIGRINLKTGEELDGVDTNGEKLRGLAIGYNGNSLFSLEVSGSEAFLYQRRLSDLSITDQLFLANSSIYEYIKNIFVDEENNIFVPAHKPSTYLYYLEKYAFYGVQDIVGIEQRERIIEIISDYTGTLIQEDNDYDLCRDAEEAIDLVDEGDPMVIAQTYDDEDEAYIITRMALFFDTSNKNITEIQKASIGLYKFDEELPKSSFDIVIQNGQPDFPHKPLIISDYSRANYSGDGGSINVGNWKEGYKEIELNEDGISWINKTGYTKFIVRNKNEINGIAPQEEEIIAFYGHTASQSYRPKLTVWTSDNCFKVLGNYERIYKEGVSIEVKNSTGNNGTYTVAEGGASYDGKYTIIPVEEKINSEIADGTINRVGNKSLLASIETPYRIISYWGVVVMGDSVYIGCWKNYPLKADRDLTEVTTWYPSDCDWEYDDYWGIAYAEDRLFLYGCPEWWMILIYDLNLKKVEQRGLANKPGAIGGCPHSLRIVKTKGAEMVKEKGAERRPEKARVRLYGELL